METAPVLDGAVEKAGHQYSSGYCDHKETCGHPEAAVEFVNYFYNDDTALETLGDDQKRSSNRKGKKDLL